MKVYISGPITGTEDFKERFYEAEKDLKKIFPESEVINPVKLCEGLDPIDSTWFDYMDKCVKALKHCTHIRMISGWQESKGALVEFYMAKEKLLLFV